MALPFLDHSVSVLHSSESDAQMDFGCQQLLQISATLFFKINPETWHVLAKIRDLWDTWHQDKVDNDKTSS